MAFNTFRLPDCLHNYIGTEASIIRKGAISAKEGEPVIIPFSMAESAIIGTGKGNADWNFSAPHGSGRKKTRTDSKSLSLDEYRKQMRGIWSSVIGKVYCNLILITFVPHNKKSVLLDDTLIFLLEGKYAIL